MVDFQCRLSLQNLLNLMQETAWRHADHLGHGYAVTNARGAAWVLIRQRVEMERWPEWEEQLQVRTWLRPPQAVTITRDFEFLVGDELVGRAAAHWITIDQASRRPIPLVFPDQPGQFREHNHLEWEPTRLFFSQPGPILAEFEVRPGDLDMNRHANNTRFAQWLLDALPWAVHETQILRRYEVNFLAEVRLGDKVAIRTVEGRSGRGFQGWRAADDRVLFTTRLERLGTFPNPVRPPYSGG